MNNIVFFENLKKFKQNKLNIKGIVLVGGCFDILHLGHVEFLRFAKEQGEVVVIALESDEFIKKYKKRNPVHSTLERKKILEALRYVDHVVTLPLFESSEEYFKLVETLRPSVIACTQGDAQIENKTKQAKKVGAQVRIYPYIEGFSTSSIISHGKNQ